MRRSPFVVLALGVLAACGGSKNPPAGSGGGGSGGNGGAGGAESGGPASSGAAGASSSSAGPASTAAATAPKADPIDAATPETKDAKPFARRQVCEKPPCPTAIVPAGMDQVDGKPAPIAMFEVVLGRKVMWSIPKNANVVVYGFLLDGEVSVMADDIKDKQKRCWKLDAFRAPGGGVNVFAKEPTRILVGVGAVGDAKTVTDALAKPAPWAKRPSPVESVELGRKPQVSWGGGAYHARIGFEDPGAPSFTLLLMSKNAPVAEHVHATEWEFLALIDGDGELTRKEGGNVKTTSGTFVAIPPGVAHGYRPNGTTPTLAVQMYSPAGPEQRFKKLAEKP